MKKQLNFQKVTETVEELQVPEPADASEPDISNNITEVHKGQIKVFRPVQYYGFLYDSELHEDLFFHGSELAPGIAYKIQRGSHVTFVVGSHNGRPCAQNIELSL